jgi:hypothetical protein
MGKGVRCSPSAPFWRRQSRFALGNFLTTCHHAAGIADMGFLRHTIGISRADLTRDCLKELRLWPGCETVEGLAVLGQMGGRFTVHVVDYGLAKKKLADRALRYVQREKQRRYHLK